MSNIPIEYVFKGTELTLQWWSQLLLDEFYMNEYLRTRLLYGVFVKIKCIYFIQHTFCAFFYKAK